MKERILVAVAAFSSPIKVGIYKSRVLAYEIESMDKTSLALPQIFKSLLLDYEIEGIYFSRGPGSFMALKLQYIFFKSLQSALGIPIKAADSFYFTEQNIVHATKKLAFIKRGEDIVTKSVTETDSQAGGLRLPKELIELHFSEETTPLYLLPAV